MGWGGGGGDYVLMYEMGETDNEYSGDKKLFNFYRHRIYAQTMQLTGIYFSNSNCKH